MQTILHHCVDPSIRLLPAPKIAGLLPATVGSSFTPPVSDFQYSNPRLVQLATTTRVQFFEAVEDLLNCAVTFLSAPSGSAQQVIALEDAGAAFIRTLKSLSPVPIVEVMLAHRFRSREEMDTELRALAEQMSARMSERLAAYQATHAAHAGSSRYGKAVNHE